MCFSLGPETLAQATNIYQFQGCKNMIAQGCGPPRLHEGSLRHCFASLLLRSHHTTEHQHGLQSLSKLMTESHPQGSRPAGLQSLIVAVAFVAFMNFYCFSVPRLTGLQSLTARTVKSDWTATRVLSNVFRSDSNANQADCATNAVGWGQIHRMGGAGPILILHLNFLLRLHCISCI